MKKIAMLLVLLVFFMTGCSSRVPRIEDYSWVMTSVQSGEDGQAVAYGESGSSTLDTAKKIDLYCRAADGELLLTDSTNQKTYTGTYEVYRSDPESMTYRVTIEGQDGLAVVGMTTFHDKSQAPTFIINMGEYAINFSAA